MPVNTEMPNSGKKIVAQGKELRLKQEYFFTAASIYDIIRRYKSENDDIENPEQVTSHFSKKEIKQVKRAAYALLLLTLYVVIFKIFEFTWPETFGSG